MIQTKKEFIKSKYANFIKVLIDKSSLTQEELENEPDIKSFKQMTEEDILKFGISTLQPYKKNLDFPAIKIMQTFKIDPNDRSCKLIIINYLELILSISS
jgi:hypothetical protein